MFDLPDELEWLEIIGIEPTMSLPNDSYWQYQITDSENVTLRLSYNILEQSLQTEILLHERSIQVVTQEGLISIRIYTKSNCRYIEGRCSFDNADSLLTVTLDPIISVLWSTLRGI
jgi:hypothetical protein